MALTAIPINCTLKRKGSEASSTDKMIEVIAKHLAKHDVAVSNTLRMADYDIKPGVLSDEGNIDVAALDESDQRRRQRAVELDLHARK